MEGEPELLAFADRHLDDLGGLQRGRKQQCLAQQRVVICRDRALGIPLDDQRRIHLRVHSLVLPGSGAPCSAKDPRSEEHTSELQSLMRISYAVFCLHKNNNKYTDSRTTSKLAHTPSRQTTTQTLQ